MPLISKNSSSRRLSSVHERFKNTYIYSTCRENIGKGNLQNYNTHIDIFYNYINKISIPLKCIIGLISWSFYENQYNHKPHYQV